MNLSKNFAGALASKTLQLNNSLEMSVQKKVTHITGSPLSPKASKCLAASSKRSMSHRKYQKTAKYRTRRKLKRAKLEHKFHEAKMTGQYTEEYSKGQLDDMGL